MRERCPATEFTGGVFIRGKGMKKEGEMDLWGQEWQKRREQRRETETAGG